MGSPADNMTKGVIPDSFVRQAIADLDSLTEYREFLPSRPPAQANAGQSPYKAPNDVDEFLLVFMPFLVVAVAIIAVFSK